MDLISNSQPLNATSAAPSLERRSILLRAYAEAKPKKQKRKDAAAPSEWLLFFDTETLTDETQSLRFGTFQLWEGNRHEVSGIFYDPAALSTNEKIALRKAAYKHKHILMDVDKFIETVLFQTAYVARGTVVGFNLPFDFSRLAIDWQRARRVRRPGKPGEASFVDHSMVGGFTLKLSKRNDRPHLRIKHLSRRASFINFARAADDVAVREKRKHGKRVDHVRGFFLDLKTLAAALTSNSHSLDSLATALGVERKVAFDDFDREIDAEFIHYAITDTEVTRQCYVALIAQYEQHSLKQTSPHRIYSEASMGKAYLREMNIQPWRAIQPDFDPKIIGAIMSSYFGGRAEIHRRREIVQTLYCDFASMYPSVCTLMGLWNFVIADGLVQRDATIETQDFLDIVAVSDLQNPETWKRLSVLVNIQPDADIFPVRARYGEEPIATIGVNYLTADKPLWFTLADCIASKLLSGKTPKIVEAIEFSAGELQKELRSIFINGKSEYSINPSKDDFYKRVIDLRRSVKDLHKAAKKAGASQAALKRLDSEQLALKILANATSYGIFIELNVEDADEAAAGFQIHASAGTRTVNTGKLEEPGDFFHPLLGTLITGAARLMLAITERLLIDRGLDWVFCDTDSMAFAAPNGMAVNEFVSRVRDVCGWFENLNPYETKGSILEFEDQNYSLSDSGEKIHAPLYCAAVSAKRYALFNLDALGEPTIRKASAHGLGHYLPPYREADDKRSRDSGVHLWQEDIWKEIIKSLRSDNPMYLGLDWREEISHPAVSQYSATTPDRLDWFKEFNRERASCDKVRPFNFMLEFYGKRPDDMAREDALEAQDGARRQPKPVAPYSRNPYSMLPKIWDRVTRQSVPEVWLRTYADALRGYHRHPETKFLQGGPMDSGPTQRRHILVEGIEDIGKEADRWDDDEPIMDEDDISVSYGVSNGDKETMLQIIGSVSKRQLAGFAKVSTRSIPVTLDAADRMPDIELRRLFGHANVLADRAKQAVLDDEAIRRWLERRIELEGLNSVAVSLCFDVANLSKVVSGKRKISRNLRLCISTLAKD